MSPETRVGITKVTAVELYFSDYYGVDEHVLDAHGAFDISVVSDLPLFVDPFLLFNSPKAEYQGLHEESSATSGSYATTRRLSCG
jgi:hypothetical protein